MNWIKPNELCYNKIVSLLNKKESGNRKAKVFFIVFLLLCSVAFLWYKAYILSMILVFICIMVLVSLSKKLAIEDVYTCAVGITSVDHRVVGNSESYFTVYDVSGQSQLRVLGSRELGRKFDVLSSAEKDTYRCTLVRYSLNDKITRYYLIDNIL